MLPIPIYHVELVLRVREHGATWLLVLVPVGVILIAHRVLGVLLHVFLQSEAILCRMLSFRVERAGRLYHLLEVLGKDRVLSRLEKAKGWVIQDD